MLLREHFPELRVRFVNVVDLMALQAPSQHPHGIEDTAFDAMFTSEKRLSIRLANGNARIISIYRSPVTHTSMPGGRKIPALPRARGCVPRGRKRAAGSFTSYRTTSIATSRSVQSPRLVPGDAPLRSPGDLGCSPSSRVDPRATVVP